MIFKEIQNDILYCGLNDNVRKLFDELIPLEHGTTYNSYIIKGNEKTAVIDTMYAPMAEEYLANFDKNGITKVDYIIANHGEQDHTGAIPKMLEKFPEAKIVTNPKCQENIMNMLLVPADKFITLADGEELSLGNITLKFIFTPFVHWPDTMFTYIKEYNYLFTCDFLGAHLTFDDIYARNDDELYTYAKRYYAEIMMPFRSICKKYLDMIKDLKPDMVLPSHGPICKDPSFILDCYTEWCAPEGKNLVLIPYVSMYKSVEEMAQYVSKRLNEKNINSVMYDIAQGDLGDLAVNLVDATTIIIGSSMVLANPHPMAAYIAYLVGLLSPKAKYTSFLGSYGWGGNLFGKLKDLLGNFKAEIIEPVQIKGKLKPDDYKLLDTLVESICEKHKVLFPE